LPVTVGPEKSPELLRETPALQGNERGDTTQNEGQEMQYYAELGRRP